MLEVALQPTGMASEARRLPSGFVSRGSRGLISGQFIKQHMVFDSSYYRARYYDANVGRFLTEDPDQGGSLDDNFNLYGYVENNSLNRVDPLGLYTLKPGGKTPPLPSCLSSFSNCTPAKEPGAVGPTKLWVGHANRDVTDRYADQLKEDVELRKEVAENAGLGFKLPTVEGSVGLLGLPKQEKSKLKTVT
jgi:RHS repeat-associated protein